MKKTTLGFIIQNKKILLAMKKRGFGVGLYNGVGGKVENGETPEQAMIREAEEEIGIIVKELEYIGNINFYFEGNCKWNQSVSLFVIKSYIGDIKETEEMKPYWFDLDKIPYDNMWKDDKIWLSDVISGKKNIKYNFWFDKNGELKNWEKVS